MHDRDDTVLFTGVPNSARRTNQLQRLRARQNSAERQAEPTA